MKNTSKVILAAAALGATAVSAATVSSEFSATESFSAIPDVSSTDLANGITATFDLGTLGANNINPISVLTDGAYGSGFGVNPGNGGDTPQYKIDLGSLQSVGTVNSYSHGNNLGGIRQAQIFELYGSASSTDPGFIDDGGWTLIDSVDLQGPTGTDLNGASSISGINADYQWLLWVTQPVSGAGGGEHTIWKEFDVIAVPEPSVALLGGLGLFGLLRRRRD